MQSICDCTPMFGNAANYSVPHEVVSKHIDHDITYLLAWREYLGLPLAEVAESAGITQAALSQMENGESRICKDTKEKLARAMGINLEQLEADTPAREVGW